MAQTTAAGTGDRLMTTLRGGLTVFGVCALLALSGCGGGSEETADGEPATGASSQTVTVAAATTRDLARTVTASGT
ncbi:MAG: hypothetical protein V7678_07350, partial [Brevundimonas sp.]